MNDTNDDRNSNNDSDDDATVNDDAVSLLMFIPSLQLVDSFWLSSLDDTDSRTTSKNAGSSIHIPYQHPVIK